MLARWSSRGDTIIEVLVAIGVFAAVAVGALSLMNRGTASAQRALEITQVKQQIDAQAEALRAAHDVYATNIDRNPWRYATHSGRPTPNNTQELTVGNRCPNSYGGRVFALNPRTLAPIATADLKSINVSGAPLYARYEPAGAAQGMYGIWIERKRTVSARGPAVYDFRIRACWYGAGTAVPMQLQTVVRLYEIT